MVTSNVTAPDSSGGYAEPATGVAKWLGLTNFDVYAFVPPGCLLTQFDFFDKLMSKTIAVAIISAFPWLPYLYAKTRGLHEKTTLYNAMALKSMMFWLEIALPSVSTTIVQSFKCDNFETETFLRAQVTVACTGRRYELWRRYAIVMLILYPILVPISFMVLVGRHRHAIKRLAYALKEHDKVMDRRTGLDDLRESLSHERDKIKRKVSREKRRTSRGSTRVRERAESVGDMSILTLTEQLRWLSTKVERYEPTCWWMNIYLVLLGGVTRPPPPRPPAPRIPARNLRN